MHSLRVESVELPLTFLWWPHRERGRSHEAWDAIGVAAPLAFSLLTRTDCGGGRELRVDSSEGTAQAHPTSVTANPRVSQGAHTTLRSTVVAWLVKSPSSCVLSAHRQSFRAQRENQ